MGELTASGNVYMFLLWVSITANVLCKGMWLHNSLRSVTDLTSICLYRAAKQLSSKTSLLLLQKQRSVGDRGCVRENTVACSHCLLKFHPTDKIRQVKPESAFVAAPFPCQNEFSSHWFKHSWGQHSHALMLSRSIGFYSEHSLLLLKQKDKQRFQIPIPAAADCPKVLQKKPAISGPGLVPGFPGAGQMHSPHLLFRGHTYL